MDMLTSGAYKKDELEDGLIDWILRNDQQIEFSNEYRKDPKSDLDFIASKFVQDLEKNNTDLFNDLALIHSGAIVSELVLDFKMPETSKDKARDLNIILDAPFVMHLLKLSGKQHYESTNGIFEQLKSLEVQIHIFKHSCEEIEGSIDGVLNPNNPEKRGPLAAAIFSREIIPDYAKTVRNNLDKYIKDLGIKIFDPDSYGAQLNKEKYFSKESQDRFYDAITWENSRARDRDVNSVSIIMRWRGRTKERDFLKSKYLFVTNNTRLASKSRWFCIDENLIKAMHAPPVISVQTLSGILFLMLGDEEKKLSLSRKQLLASCGRAVIANPGIIEAYSNKLKELSPTDTDQITAILSEPKTVQLVMDKTGGNVDAITRDNIEEMMESLKEDIAVEQTKKHKKKISTISKERDHIANDNALLRANQKKTIEKVIFKAIKNRNRILFAIKFFIVCISFTALLISVFGSVSTNVVFKSILLVAGVCGLAINVYPFYLSPEWFSKRIQNWKKLYVGKKLNEVGLKEKLAEYSVDWKSGSISEINGSLFN